jgi:hypothetical protein
MVFQLWKRAFLAPASAVAAPARVAPRDVVPRFDPAAAALREASP